jgi:hypothetical protein
MSTCTYQMCIKGNTEHIKTFIDHINDRENVYECEVLHDRETQDNESKFYLSGSCDHSVKKSLLSEQSISDIAEKLNIEIYSQTLNEDPHRLGDYPVKGLKTDGYDEHYIINKGAMIASKTSKVTVYFTEKYENTGVPLDEFNEIANANLTQGEYEAGEFVKRGGYTNWYKDIPPYAI